MRQNSIIAAFLFSSLLVSCKLKTAENDAYPNNPNICNEKGEPKDSLTFYFPSLLKVSGQETKTEIDTFLLQYYSRYLLAFKEPVLCNFYMGHDTYRFLWLRSFNRPVVISIHKEGDEVWLTTKELDRQLRYLDGIVFGPPDGDAAAALQRRDSMIKRNSQANIIMNQTYLLSSAEWEKFEDLLRECSFWTMNPVDTGVLGFDGAEWIIEGHLQDKYRFIDRWSPDGSFSECGKYLIRLSGLKEEIY